MTEDDIVHVDRSFARIFAARRNVAIAFYAKLFDRAPQVRELFPDDMARQFEKLNVMLAAVVQQMHQPDRLRGSLEALAGRHMGYGATSAHYAVVGEVLLEVLADETPKGLSPRERAAWAAAYAWITGVMLAVTENPSLVDCRSMCDARLG